MSSLSYCVYNAVTGCGQSSPGWPLLELLEKDDSAVKTEHDAVELYINFPRWIERLDLAAKPTKGEAKKRQGGRTDLQLPGSNARKSRAVVTDKGPETRARDEAGAAVGVSGKTISQLERAPAASDDDAAGVDWQSRDASLQGGVCEAGRRVQGKVDRYVKADVDDPRAFLLSLRPFAVADLHQWLCENPDAAGLKDAERWYKVKDRLQDEDIGYERYEVGAAERGEVLPEEYWEQRDHLTDQGRMLCLKEWRDKHRAKGDA